MRITLIKNKFKLFKLILIQIIIKNIDSFNQMSKFGSLATFAGIALMGINASLYVVDPGEKALIMNKFGGLRQKVYGQGYHFLIPFVQTAIIYDTRFKPYDITVATGTKDLQQVMISLRILQQPIADHLPTIHQILGRDYDKKVFNSIGQQVLRTIVAQYDADQLLKSRETISKQIKKQLYSKAQSFNVNVADVSFMNLQFGKQYAKAVQRRAVQQQLAERQKFIVLRDQQLKTAQIIRSEAEAEAAKLINESVKKYGSTQIEIKKLEAAKNIAQMLSKNPNISFVPSNNTGNLLNLRV